jgi:hypothetical protein
MKRAGQVACVALIREVYVCCDERKIFLQKFSPKFYSSRIGKIFERFKAIISESNLVISAIICDIYVFAKDLNNHVRHFSMITARK